MIGAVFEVANTLRAGFLEKVYERALLQELRIRGMRAASRVSFPVIYKGQCAGICFADILAEDTVVIKLQGLEQLGREQVAQCLNYLGASGLEVCRLINLLKPTMEWKPVAYSRPV